MSTPTIPPILTDKVIATYDQGAPDYDGIMARYWPVDRQPLIDSLNLQPGQTVLDAAVGTGLNLPSYPAGVTVIGADLSEGMIAIARQKPVKANVSFQTANLEQLPFADNQFDAIASGFTLCVVADPVKAMQELIRVSKPGAPIAIVDYCLSRQPHVQKWQEMIADATANYGFPTGVIQWNALMDYDQLIYHSDLPIRVVSDERMESENPFSCGCQLLLENAK